MPLAPGSKLGRYDVVAFVGAGGMGEVYRARDTELGRDVALKVLRPDRDSDGDARRRLIQEARTASALNHPNIATVHDVVEADGVHCIVMEYVAGRPLSAVIRAGLSVDDGLRIAIAVADALARAHAAGIVHRDLKPANVVVSDDGVPKVLDFGIDKLVDASPPPAAAAQDDTTTDRTGTAPRWPTSGFGGTPGYVAPEQVTGARVDARSDIFSFGSLLYEMCTGRRAFHGATAADTIADVLARQPAAPRALVPEIPEALEQAVLRCLRKEPERRFQSIADVKVVLEDIAEARLRPAAGAAAPAARRLPWIAAGVLAAALAATALIAWWPTGDTATPPPRLEPLTTASGIESSVTFSPDGRQFAYAFGPETFRVRVRTMFSLEDDYNMTSRQGRIETWKVPSTPDDPSRRICGVIITTSSVRFFWAALLRNSWPRIGMSPMPGIFVIVEFSELFMRPAIANVWPSRSSSSVDVRRVDSAGMRNPLICTALEKSSVLTSGATFR